MVLSRFEKVSVNCTPRRKDGALRQSVRNVVAGRFVKWRVAQLHLARRTSSKFITRDAQNGWRGAQA
ncbi:hypothetical protein A2U01_0071716 [Trifolium medium]|uniref:Uncharacterized protein n=1 Tax=Trifolium medium TaxID=97028 RepID=A0A392SPY0_9FABA|nr:hypothetical protein [Trifolium medium]